MTQDPAMLILHARWKPGDGSGLWPLSSARNIRSLLPAVPIQQEFEPAQTWLLYHRLLGSVLFTRRKSGEQTCPERNNRLKASLSQSRLSPSPPLPAPTGGGGALTDGRVAVFRF